MLTCISPATGSGIALRYVGLRWTRYAAVLVAAWAVFASAQPAFAFEDRFGESPGKGRIYKAQSRGEVVSFDRASGSGAMGRGERGGSDSRGSGGGGSDSRGPDGGGFSGPGGRGPDGHGGTDSNEGPGSQSRGRGR